MIARHLATEGQLEAFAHQVRLVRGRFRTYEPIDFLALLIGYAISGERTLADFFERVEPFESAFMALFGRRCLLSVAADGNRHRTRHMVATGYSC